MARATRSGRASQQRTQSRSSHARIPSRAFPEAHTADGRGGDSRAGRCDVACRSSSEFSLQCVGGGPLRSAGQRDRVRELQARAPTSEWDISGAGDSDIQGFATEISVNAGSPSTSRWTPARQLHHRHLPHRLVPGPRRPQDRRRHADRPSGRTSRSASRTSPRNSTTAATGPSRRPGRCPSTAVSGVYFALLTRPDTGSQSHITFIVRNDAQPLGRCLPDLRHHVAGLQHLRRL